MTMRMSWWVNACHRRRFSLSCRESTRRPRRLLQSRHDLFFEKIERVDHFLVGEIADVEHAHEVICANLPHLALDLFGDRVWRAGDQIAAVDESIPVELGKIAPLAVSLAKIAEGAFRGERGGQFLSHGILVDRFIEATVE